MPVVVGNDPNQVPTNADLGPLAFRDENPVGDVVGTSAIQVLSGKSFSDNVGIGTSLPGANLDVFGATRFSADTYGRVEVTPTGGNGGTAVIRQYTSPPRNGGDLKIQVDRSISGGNLLFATGSSTETMRLDYLGNIGLGVVPSAWGSVYRAVEVNAACAIVGTSGASRIVNNAYHNGTSWLYRATIPAQMYEQVGTQHAWYTAPSGTAGSTISFTQAMTLDASGNLGVGTTSPVSNGRTLTVSNSGSGTSALYLQNSGTGATATDGFTLQVDSSSNGYVWNYEAGAVLFGTSASERMRLDSSGRLLVGAAGVLGSEALRVYRASNSRVVIDQASSGLVLGSDASGPFIDTTTATRLAVFVGGTERMRIEPTGNLGVGATPSAWGSDYRAISINSGGAGVASASRNLLVVGNAYNDNSSWRYVAGAPSAMYNCNGLAGQHEWHVAPSGTAGSAISFTQAMTLNASGNLLVGRTAQSSGGKLEVGGNVVCQPSVAAPTLGTNGDMSFQLVSNTSLKILVRGSDGVTRSTTLTLA